MSEKAEEKQTPPRAPSLDDSINLTEPSSSTDANDIVPGSDGVTYGDLSSLRHVRDSFPIASFLVVFVEFAERWSYYGTANIYNNYIRAPLPRGSTTGAVLKADRSVGIAGALGKGQPTSFALRTFNSFFVFVTPILGGILADTLWGRYKTIMLSSLVCLAGHVILVGSAAPSALSKDGVSLGLLVLSILVIGLGAGCIKSNVSPMIAEQYQGKMHKKMLKSGEEVIVSPEVTIQSVYLWFYAAINFGSTGAISASFLARDHGYWVAYLVPTLIFVLVPLVLMAGKNIYVVTPPRGSILLETFRVIGMALAPAWSWNPVITLRNAGHVPSRITWDDEFVGEVSRTVSACGVFLFFPFFWLCYSQIDGNLGTTAAAMKLNGTPNDLIQNLNPISIIILIPIFDGLIYPFLRRRGINFSPIKRIYAGFLVAGLAMVYASVLQHYIGIKSPCGPHDPALCTHPHDGSPEAVTPWPADINVWVVSGPYILVGIAEIFASITSIEYAFTKAPSRMKSVVMSFSQLQTAIASAINFALTAVNVESKFVWLYGSFAIVSWIVGTTFFIVFRDLDRREYQLNAIGRGQRQGFAGETPEMTSRVAPKAEVRQSTSEKP
ncbi:peptide transporter PTR2B [Coprinellus micaceus]|uniref:Peptide transporter PTR2B n=1 Tax=Coprinellus micaceus TaxID=71717 RepID=A0A4Y7SGE2_COPMI|nr:peptide transporter PTR2B [Coprinellus micaceus]